MCTTVVVFCHSKQPILGKFLFRAQHHNMTNGDYAFFTFWAQKYIYTDMPWLAYVTDKKDIPRLMPVFHVVKQVSICYTSHGKTSYLQLSMAKRFNHNLLIISIISTSRQENVSFFGRKISEICQSACEQMSVIY